MATAEVEVIPWDKEGKVKQVLEEHIIHVKSETSRGAPKLFYEGVEELMSSDDLEWFMTHLFSIVGMEVEGQEISMGFLYFKDGIPRNVANNFKYAKLGRWVASDESKDMNLGQEGFKNYRRIVRKIRSELVGWVSGRFLEPVIILTGEGEDNKPRIRDIKILHTRKPSIRTANELYKEITETNDCFVIWVKPAGSIRIYRKEKLFGQIMRLRDVGGWTTRHVGRLIEIVKCLSSSAGLNLDETTCRRWIIEPSISMSESRRGCTIVVMKKNTFEDLESKWGNNHGEVSCKAKHAPIDDEQESYPTEAEYENYLTQDGAIVISPSGKLLGMGTYFQGGPGGRRATAAWLPKVIDNCLTVVTSQDGPIYLHWSEQENHVKQVKGIRLDFIPTCTSNPIEIEPDKKEDDVNVAQLLRK